MAGKKKPIKFTRARTIDGVKIKYRTLKNVKHKIGSVRLKTFQAIAKHNVTKHIKYYSYETSKIKRTNIKINNYIYEICIEETTISSEMTGKITVVQRLGLFGIYKITNTGLKSMTNAGCFGNAVKRILYNGCKSKKLTSIELITKVIGAYWGSYTFGGHHNFAITGKKTRLGTPVSELEKKLI